MRVVGMDLYPTLFIFRGSIATHFAPFVQLREKNCNPTATRHRGGKPPLWKLAATLRPWVPKAAGAPHDGGHVRSGRREGPVG